MVLWYVITTSPGAGTRGQGEVSPPEVLQAKSSSESSLVPEPLVENVCSF